VGGKFRNRCTPGDDNHNFALLECQKTCRICVGKTPYAASELSTKNMTTTYQGRCASALPTSTTYTAQSKRTVNPDMAGSVVLVDCAAGFNTKPEGDHVVTFLRCDWNATTTLYEWVAHGTCSNAYVFQDSAELQTAVNLWSSNRAAALTTYGHISTNWDTSKVTSFMFLFATGPSPGNTENSCYKKSWLLQNPLESCSSKTFNDPIGAWDTSSVTDMGYMFLGVTAFNQPLNTWNTSSVTTMGAMFKDATAFNQPLDAWDTSNVKHMSDMFKGATAFNQPLDAWDKSSVTGMINMFNGATSYNQPLGAWSTPKLSYVYGMFTGATAMSHPVPSATLRTANENAFGTLIWG
jgi:surface protein